MRSESKGRMVEPWAREVVRLTPSAKQRHTHRWGFFPIAAAAFSLLCSGVATADGDSANHLRQYIARKVGGLDKLMVPADNADLPQPRLADGSLDPDFQITEAKRYLGKQLFHDPVRAVRIIPEFGGVPATAGTSSCGSCHLGEAASKAGAVFNFASGGEGHGYTDSKGNFIPRRRPRLDILPMLRQDPLFPGDELVDELCTLTDVYEHAVGSPARGRKLPDPGALLRTGRLDALDSVCRTAPGVIGAAFNNRLLMGGFAGEPDESPGGLNPFGYPAQESVALLLLDAHRMLDSSPSTAYPGPFQSAELRKRATYRLLFREAFPAEAAGAPGCIPETDPTAGECDSLINDITVLRATAAFMRTAVTRNTPWDHFLAGDNRALTPAQRRGAKLFFTPATKGGAGCYSCHSGPMLNKQVNDPDVAGVGEFVEENFYNLGLDDHPRQALNILATGDPGYRDDGRREITARDSDAFKFRVVTLRQVRDGRFYFHNGSLSSVKDVVKYFNAGVPQNAEAAAASSFTSRFSFPRGPGSRRGLGLSRDQVEDLTDFLENALYDPGFVHFDPSSPTDTFKLNDRDFLYSVYRPDLAALGAVDGRPASGLPPDSDDALSRRDLGLEFLDVSGQLDVRLIDTKHSGDDHGSRRQQDVYRITNTSASIVDTHLLIVVRGLSKRDRMVNTSGTTGRGDPYLRVFLKDGVLNPGQSIKTTLRFRRHSHASPPSYSLEFLSGQGNP